jgi:two-component system, cell cycle response regulator DivK
MKTILVLEDDPKIAIALAVRLEAAGYHVLTAPDGVRGLKIALVNRPDLILMDIWMPVGLGFSVAQRLKDLGLRNIPVIFITASRLKGLREAATKLGAVGYFEKPYDPEQLLGTIHQALYRPTFTASPTAQTQLVSSMSA